MFETLTEGQHEAAKPEIRTFDIRTDCLVIKTGILLYSLCEHHILPFYSPHVAYRPDGEMVELSKLVRYVRWQSRRMTTQRTLTRDIMEDLARELDSDGVIAETSVTHSCMAMRGVETVTATTTRGLLVTSMRWRRSDSGTQCDRTAISLLDRFNRSLAAGSTLHRLDDATVTSVEG